MIHPATTRQSVSPVFAARTLDTPDGPFTVIEDVGGSVIASGWDDDVTRLFSRAKREGVLKVVEWNSVSAAQHRTAENSTAAVEAVRAYYRGDPGPIREVAVAQHGTPLQLAVWNHMRDIRPGAPETYSQLAEALGRPRAFRAVANTCARNACGLFVPCHRVIAASGKVTGFAWGRDVKTRLLARELGA